MAMGLVESDGLTSVNTHLVHGVRQATPPELSGGFAQRIICGGGLRFPAVFLSAACFFGQLAVILAEKLTTLALRPPPRSSVIPFAPTPP